MLNVVKTSVNTVECFTKHSIAHANQRGFIYQQRKGLSMYQSKWETSGGSKHTM